jgi:hypothetical protein
MKRILNNSSIRAAGLVICVLAGLTCILTGCRKSPAKPAAVVSGVIGSVVFSDSMPEGEFVVYVTPETEIDWAYLSNALYISTAIGSSADIDGSSVVLYPSGTMNEHFEGTPFDKNGVYTVILGTRLPHLGFKFATGIVFKDGKAVLSVQEMADL